MPPEQAITIVSINPLVAIGPRAAFVGLAQKRMVDHQHLVRLSWVGASCTVVKAVYARPYRFDTQFQSSLTDCVWASPEDGTGLQPLDLSKSASRVRIAGCEFQLTQFGSTHVVSIPGLIDPPPIALAFIQLHPRNPADTEAAYLASTANAAKLRPGDSPLRTIAVLEVVFNSERQTFDVTLQSLETAPFHYRLSEISMYLRQLAFFKDGKKGEIYQIPTTEGLSDASWVPTKMDVDPGQTFTASCAFKDFRQLVCADTATVITPSKSLEWFIDLTSPFAGSEDSIRENVSLRLVGHGKLRLIPANTKP